MDGISDLFGQHVSGILSSNSICIESTFQSNGFLIVLMANKSVKKLRKHFTAQTKVIDEQIKLQRCY